jgi:hypothetical protein
LADEGGYCGEFSGDETQRNNGGEREGILFRQSEVIHAIVKKEIPLNTIF